MHKSKLPMTQHPTSPTSTSWLGALKAPATVVTPMRWAHARQHQLWSFFKDTKSTTRSH